MQNNANLSNSVIKNKRPNFQRRRTSESIPARYNNRPASIRAAIHRTWEYSITLGFTKSTTAVLQAILATGVSTINPFDPVFAKKENLAKLAGCSEASVYRALNTLEKTGWIIRHPQERLEDGSLDIGLIVITKRLAELLGLITIKNLSSTNNTKNKSQNLKSIEENNNHNKEKSITTSVDNSKEDSSKLPFTKMKDGLTDGPINKGLTEVDQETSVNNQSQPAFIRIDGRSVARELYWLISEKKLTFGGLFELQKLAKKVPGQLLSDFVAYKQERIKELKTTNDCYRYLKKLISEGIDARYLYAQKKQKELYLVNKQQKNEIIVKHQAWCRIHDGLIYQRPGDTVTYKVNGQHGLLEIGENGLPTNRRYLKISGRFIFAVEKGRLLRFTPQPMDHDSVRRHLADLAALFPSISRRFKGSVESKNCDIRVG
jgi:hypothetical protein